MAPANPRCSRQSAASFPPPPALITFRGENLLGRPAASRAHLGIAHVPEGRQVFKTLTVRENLEMGAYPKAGRAQWHHTLERIHTLFPILAERATQLAGTLSGGEQQMVAIGRGLACSAETADARRTIHGPRTRSRRHDLRAHFADPP